MALRTTETENDKWGIAVAFNVFGNFISAYGWMLQKQTHNEQETTTKDSLSYLQQFKWWSGYFTYGLGSAIGAVSYGMGPQSLLLPLESLVIVFNAMFGAKFLNEHLYKKDYIGIALILFGLIISVVVGPKGVAGFYTADDLQLLFQQPEFLIFMGIYSLISFTDWILITVKYIKHDTFLMVSFCFIAAYFGSWNCVAVTCFAAIIGSSFTSAAIAKDNFTHWLTYIIMLIWGISVLLLEYWRQKALADYVSTYVMSIYRVFMIAGGILSAAFFFNDFAYSTDKEIILFTFAICVAMSGVFIVATKVDENDKLEDRKTTRAVSYTQKQYIKQPNDDTDNDSVNGENNGIKQETDLLV